MSTFNLDPDVVMQSIIEGLESVGSDVSESQFMEIADTINDKFPGVIEVLTYGMQEHWKDEAINSGSGWGQKYANAVKAEVTGNIGKVWIDEDMQDKNSNKPNIMFVKMVEEGMKSFSIKEGLLASDKAKVSSTGIRYIIVPFPVRAPAKPGQGKPARKFGGREMTEEAHKIVTGGGKFSGKLKSGQEVSGLTQYVTRQRHSQFGMFRMVTENSKGWQHPGRGPSPVFPSVLQEVDKQVNAVISEFVKAVVQKYTQI